MAQVSSPAALFEEARYFAITQEAKIEEFSPQILLGSSEDLLSLAKRVEQCRLNLRQVDRAVFALTDYHDAPLRDQARAVLWQAFGVPIYELFLGGDGVLLAAECEAYEGWHVENGVTFFSEGGQLWYRTRRGHSGGTGLTGDIQTQPCPCGRATQRLVNVSMDFHDAVRHYSPVSA